MTDCVCALVKFYGVFVACRFFSLSCVISCSSCGIWVLSLWECIASSSVSLRAVVKAISFSVFSFCIASSVLAMTLSDCFTSLWLVFNARFSMMSSWAWFTLCMMLHLCRVLYFGQRFDQYLLWCPLLKSPYALAKNL